jgi:hypothetical protein
MFGNKPMENLSTDDRTEWDIDGMTEELFRELNGSVSRATVERTLCSLFASYEDAPVKSFVPIIVRRQALDLLHERANNGS